MVNCFLWLFNLIRNLQVGFILPLIGSVTAYKLIVNLLKSKRSFFINQKYEIIRKNAEKLRMSLKLMIFHNRGIYSATEIVNQI